MKKVTYLVAFVGVLLAYSIAVAAGTTQYRATECANGYGGAYTISMFDAGGCLWKIVGFDCNGKEILWIGRTQQVPGDLQYPFDHYFSGISNGQAWFAKVQLSSSGEVGRVWGKMADGQYYESIAAN